MPAPTNQPLFRWQYTVLDDNVFSDGYSTQMLSITGNNTDGYVATLTVGLAV